MPFPLIHTAHLMNLGKQGKQAVANECEENKGECYTTKKRETKSLYERTVNNIKSCNKRRLKMGQGTRTKFLGSQV